MKLSNQSLKKTINKIISPWYLLPLIDRWLLGQIIPPMIFAISAFTVISLSVGVMFDLIRKIVEFGLPLFLALKVLFFSLPSFLVLSFPMAVLLSTLLAYGKLSSNSELLALKSLGIKTTRIISPAIALSIFMTGLTFYFNDNLVVLSSSVINVKDLNKDLVDNLTKDAKDKISDKNLTDHDRYVLNHKLDVLKEMRI